MAQMLAAYKHKGHVLFTQDIEAETLMDALNMAKNTVHVFVQAANESKPRRDRIAEGEVEIRVGYPKQEATSDAAQPAS